jgi:hypothetical protein
VQKSQQQTESPRLITMGLLLPGREKEISIQPPMSPSEQPYAVHVPPGAIGIFDPRADGLILRNLSERPVFYTLIVAGKDVVDAASEVNTVWKAGKALGRLLEKARGAK